MQSAQLGDRVQRWPLGILWVAACCDKLDAEKVLRFQRSAMPELPEAEVVRRQLDAALRGATIEHVWIGRKEYHSARQGVVILVFRDSPG